MKNPVYFPVDNLFRCVSVISLLIGMSYGLQIIKK